MKKTLLLLFIALNSCCSNTDTVTYKLSEEEKGMLPYQKHQAVKWQNNSGTIISGTVLDRSTSISAVSDHDCKRFEGENLTATISINNEKYSVSLEKKDTDRVDLYVSQRVNDRTEYIFATDLRHSGFTTVYFNNETFHDAVKLEVYGEDNSVLATLIYTKENGIAFILFEDGLWYKRME